MSSSSQTSRAAAPPATESLFARVVLTPLLFISFIISLFLIDKKTYSSVLNGHKSSDEYYHSHQRKLAKREMEDAFHMRNRVLAAICIFGGIGFALVGWTGSKAWYTIFPGLSHA
ncbi:hypothetical protein H2198_001462 [Neophaeococcomyces mojaviensis]|uniref:Uncharacterized protein n=1 Tax=Neophaeococcomyces mojaviensis TaxID=3383035 RepID=A0ACC3AGY7_9EURO|nr:hypothetical protein H2198_001462 [Knufia sp. JES_112]